MPIHAGDGDPNESPPRRVVEAGWCTVWFTLENLCGTTAGDRGLCLLAAWGGYIGRVFEFAPPQTAKCSDPR